MGAHRSILATNGFHGDTVEKLIVETNSGFYCPTIENIKRALKKFYLEYRLKGVVSFQGNIKEINKYPYNEMARKFAALLEECTK